jgi:heme A synthase
MSAAVSITDLTVHAGWMLGLAVFALVLAGWRKTARAVPRIPRSEPIIRRRWVPIGIAETTAPLYKRPGPVRRIWALVAGVAIAIVTGAVLATTVAYGLAFVVSTLTDLLKQ